MSHPRAIQSSEELRLLVKIFESQSQHAEIVKILDSETLGLKSRIVRRDKNFLICKATALASAGLWEEGLAFVKDLYTVNEDGKIKKNLREVDDWGIWSLLVEAVRNIKTPGFVSRSRRNIPTRLTCLLRSLELLLKHRSLSRNSSRPNLNPAMRLWLMLTRPSWECKSEK